MYRSVTNDNHLAFTYFLDLVLFVLPSNMGRLLFDRKTWRVNTVRIMLCYIIYSLIKIDQQTCLEQSNTSSPRVALVTWRDILDNKSSQIRKQIGKGKTPHSPNNPHSAKSRKGACNSITVPWIYTRMLLYYIGSWPRTVEGGGERGNQRRSLCLPLPPTITPPPLHTHTHTQLVTRVIQILAFCDGK